MDWIMDGIGTELVGFLLSLVAGGAAGYVGSRSYLKQKVKNHGPAIQVNENSQDQGKDSPAPKTGSNQAMSFEKNRGPAYGIQIGAINWGPDSDQMQKLFTQLDEKINIRTGEFWEQLVRKFVEKTGNPPPIKEPATYRAVQEACKSAACSDHPGDFDLLIRMLLDREESGQDRIETAAIDYAISVSDRVDQDALRALTVAAVNWKEVPDTGSVLEGLDHMDRILGALEPDKLPSCKGSLWQDHLDLLKLVRYSNTGSMKGLKEFYCEKFPGYVATGIPKDSPDYIRALSILRNADLSEDLLVEHELDRDYVRLPVVHPDRLGTFSRPDCLRMIYGLYEQSPETVQRRKERFFREMDRRPNLVLVGDWYGTMRHCFDINAAGIAMARANLRAKEIPTDNLTLSKL